MKQQRKESTVVDTRTEEARASGIQRCGIGTIGFQGYGLGEKMRNEGVCTWARI